MIQPSPAYAFTARHALSRWYGHVHLLPDHILGQWFCLDRRSGRPLWERRYFRPNSIIGVDDSVIVAYEIRSDGPWTAGFGCYGLSLTTGELLWTSHRNGLWGRLVRLLDFVPAFTNDLRDSPVWVAGGECGCASGRILSMVNGKQIRRVPQDQVRGLGPQKPKSDAQILYDGGFANAFTRVRVAEGKWLSLKQVSGERCHGFALHLLADDGAVLWSFDLTATGYHMSHSNFYTCRYCPPYVYIVASEESSLIPHATKAHYVVPNPTIFHVLTLDLAEGQVVQDYRVGEGKFAECRIEDADERGIAISAGGRELLYYERTSG